MTKDLNWVLSAMPHKPPMLFLSEVIAVNEPTIRCRANLTPDHLAISLGKASSLLAVELFAQAAAALMVHRSRSRGIPIMGAGALLGTREITFYSDGQSDGFEVGEELIVDVTEVWGSGALAQMNGKLYRGEELVAEGSVTVAAGAPQ